VVHVPSSPPLFDIEQCLLVLQKGDWFMKWTRAEVVHRRFVWLDVHRGVIAWAKSPASNFFFQSIVKLEDIVDIRSECVVDDASGRTFYKLAVFSRERVLVIGTEIRDKFDVWYDTLSRLCENQAAYNRALSGRHASTTKIYPPSPFEKRNMMASSSD
jgi:hypothetical protein